MKRYQHILLVLAVICTPIWASEKIDPPFYSAKEMRGQVVDAETGQPLKGVIVFARWQVYVIGIGSGNYGGSINSIEVVTDDDGKYFIPGWGPRPRSPQTFLNHKDPELTYFKSNYYPGFATNTLLSYENRNTSSVRTSDWDGKVIKLKPFSGENWSDYAFRLSSAWSQFVCFHDCPHLVLAMDSESKRIKELAPKKPFIPTLIDIKNLSKEDQEFFQRFRDENK